MIQSSYLKFATTESKLTIFRSYASLNIIALCIAYKLQNADISIPLKVKTESLLQRKKNRIKNLELFF